MMDAPALYDRREAVDKKFGRELQNGPSLLSVNLSDWISSNDPGENDTLIFFDES